MRSPEVLAAADTFGFPSPPPSHDDTVIFITGFLLAIFMTLGAVNAAIGSVGG